MKNSNNMIERSNCYGFTFKLSEKDEIDRVRCEERVQERESRWEAFARKKALPGSNKLKRFLRKVRNILMGLGFFFSLSEVLHQLKRAFVYSLCSSTLPN
jgi:hypothetical protein